MITRKFTYELLEAIYTEDVKTPEGIEVVQNNIEMNGTVSYCEIIFKMVEEWNFYRFHAHENCLTQELYFASKILDDWSDDKVIECVKVVPHLEQVVVYHDAETDGVY